MEQPHDFFTVHSLRLLRRQKAFAHKAFPLRADALRRRTLRIADELHEKMRRASLFASVQRAVREMLPPLDRPVSRLRRFRLLRGLKVLRPALELRRGQLGGRFGRRHMRVDVGNLPFQLCRIHRRTQRLLCPSASSGGLCAQRLRALIGDRPGVLPDAADLIRAGSGKQLARLRPAERRHQDPVPHAQRRRRDLWPHRL